MEAETAVTLAQAKQSLDSLGTVTGESGFCPGVFGGYHCAHTLISDFLPL